MAVNITFGITEDSKARLRSVEGRFRRMDAIARREAIEAVGKLVLELREVVKRNFEPHNRTGATLRTLTLHDHGQQVSITMGGGAPYVEYGFPPHAIPLNPRAGHFLRWMDGNNPVFRKSVWNPGYEGDPFLERSMDEVGQAGLPREMSRIATKTFADVTRDLPE